MVLDRPVPMCAKRDSFCDVREWRQFHFA